MTDFQFLGELSLKNPKTVSTVYTSPQVLGRHGMTITIEIRQCSLNTWLKPP